jgi:hypothetical protein
MLTKLELSFLHACQADIVCKQVFVPLVAHQIGMPSKELFNQWQTGPDSQTHLFTGSIGETCWKYIFHGFECEVENYNDGRHLRIEFGPHGRFDTISPDTIYTYVRSSRAPWREFPKLREFFVKKSPPNAIYIQSVREMFHRLSQRGYFEAADKELCALVKKNNSGPPDSRRTDWQYKGVLDSTVHFSLDECVCGRWVLSDLGKRTIQNEPHKWMGFWPFW